MDNQIQNSIVSFIWGIADDCLRDVYVRGKYRDVILPMTVIRRLDAMLEDTKTDVLKMKDTMDKAGITNQWPALCNAADQAFCNASPFLLKDLTSRAKKQTLKADFEAYLDGFSPNVQEILEKFKFRNQIDTMIDADILGAVIEKFVSPTINLSPKPVYTDDTMTTIKLLALDNHGMGTIFEELIRKFNEENNEEAGEHWTPRDVVELMADLIIVPVADQIMDATYSCYDGACGTGGMLTVAQDRLLNIAKRRGKNVSIHLFGQEVQPETYAICKADMLLKGDGDQADHIAYGSTLSADGNATRQFDFMLANPPYGKSWKTDAEKMGGKKDILDSRFNAYLEDGTQLSMIPRTSDGQLLFLLNNVAKMKKDTPLGSRIAEVHNGSSIFTGDAGSGESNARRYLIENDLVEAIIALPENMFYNTGIGTFIWVLSNKKEERRKGKIQLIDATAMKSPLRKNMGKKNCEFTPDIRKEIMRIFLDMEESEVSKIFDNNDFAYWNVTVERPLRLRVFPERMIPTDTFKKTDEYETVTAAIAKASATAPLDDWIAFAKATKLKKAQLNKVRPFITEKDATAVATNEPDTELRDTENIPFTYEGGIEAFMQNEVLTYAPDAYIDEKKTQIGYEISFTKYFYKPVELREMSEIIKSLNSLEKEADLLMGTKLYGKPGVALRELLQNSIDACLLRQKLSELWGIEYTPKVKVSLYTKNNVDYLRVSDNGVGMNQHIIDNYYTNVGCSYYSSREFSELMVSFKSSFTPISRFGIGILSCFMVCDSMEVTTRRIRERFECDEALHISIEGYESLFVISDSNKKEPGTDTILTLRPVHPWDRMNEEEFMQCIKGIVPNPAVQIEIETNKGSELYSSDYFDDLDLKPLLDYSWNNIKNIRKIDIDLTCEAYGFKGKGCIGILIKNGLPAEEIEILSKDVEIDGEIYTLSSNIKYKTNCITETSTSISVDEDGEIDTNTSWSERFKSKASLSIHGIEVPYNLFPDYSNGMSKAALKIPFPFSFRLDIGVNSDLNLNSARDQIIYDEKWLTFEENLYRIICRRLKDTLSSSDWKILNEIIQKNNTDTFSRVANSFE